MNNRLFYSTLGILGGLSTPISWLLWRAYSTRKAWWIQWIKTELNQHNNVYLFLAVFSIAVLSLIGYLIGKIIDDRVEETKSVKKSNLALSQMAVTDGLTGLFNVRYIHEQLDVELENSYRSSLTCLMIDIDHFKQINDTYGHPFGDTVLIRLAKILKSSVRKIDLVGRLGGEEFIAILPQVPNQRAQEISERIRQDVESEEFLTEKGKLVHITVSIGIATSMGLSIKDKDHLLQAADNALYSAKKAGRNRIEVAS